MKAPWRQWEERLRAPSDMRTVPWTRAGRSSGFMSANRPPRAAWEASRNSQNNQKPVLHLKFYSAQLSCRFAALWIHGFSMFSAPVQTSVSAASKNPGASWVAVVMAAGSRIVNSRFLLGDSGMGNAWSVRACPKPKRSHREGVEGSHCVLSPWGCFLMFSLRSEHTSPLTCMPFSISK